MIAITGANGNLGKATLFFLLKAANPSDLVAVVRDPSKMNELSSSGIQIRQGDYENVSSMEEAFDGCDTIMQVSSAVYGEQADRQEKNVVNAAVNSDVKRIVYVSTLNPGKEKLFRAAVTCGATENAIADAGLQYSFFRNSMYMETIPLFVSNALADGKIYYPAGEGRISYASRIDIAEALAGELLRKRSGNEMFHITGAEAAGFDTVAALLKSEKGLDGEYTNIPDDAFAEVLLDLGMSEEEINFYISMAQSIKANEFAGVHDDLEKLLGRKRKSLKEFIREL
ncbi:NAD(P)H-binding protein [Terrimonas sp. NA20]|uniref:NAD(P)H-binding protein n=1 Tax=Terrimonas ginsenosidimutans TaxID=2908004 RepID=A0ABS9KWW3_9BACT|nr:NAD(P)H-binding protein [Terrimonas ginsenosidimutans]MCG2616803.1 NAD(P)H-binding protein [Terrimonas ginsenosidimutans]